MRATPVLHAVSGGATRGKVHAIVIGLVALVSTAAVALASARGPTPARHSNARSPPSTARR